MCTRSLPCLIAVVVGTPCARVPTAFGHERYRSRLNLLFGTFEHHPPLVQWLETVEPERIKAVDFASAHSVGVEDVTALVKAGALSGTVHKLAGVRVDKHQPLVNPAMMVSVEEVWAMGPRVAAALASSDSPRKFALLGGQVAQPLFCCAECGRYRAAQRLLSQCHHNNCYPRVFPLPPPSTLPRCPTPLGLFPLPRAVPCSEGVRRMDGDAASANHYPARHGRLRWPHHCGRPTGAMDGACLSRRRWPSARCCHVVRACLPLCRA